MPQICVFASDPSFLSHLLRRRDHKRKLAEGQANAKKIAHTDKHKLQQMHILCRRVLHCVDFDSCVVICSQFRACPFSFVKQGLARSVVSLLGCRQPWPAQTFSFFWSACGACGERQKVGANLCLLWKEKYWYGKGQQGFSYPYFRRHKIVWGLEHRNFASWQIYESRLLPFVWKFGISIT